MQVFRALLTNLSKIFDCLSHGLIIAKLNAYGFKLSALNLIHNCLSKSQSVTQGSILGPILLNFFISDLFFVVKDVNIASYADDDTFYQSGKSVDDVVNGLQVSAEKIFKWFSDYQMKRNTDK